MGSSSLEEIVQAGLAAGTREKVQKLVDAEVDQICVAEAGRDPVEVKRILLSNIGYYAGYYDVETADKIYELFDTEHPFFGRRHPTAEEAFARGNLWGYLASKKVSKAKQKTAQVFVEHKDWHGLIQWLDDECHVKVADSRDALG